MTGMAAVRKKETVNAFRIAYQEVRGYSKEIYKGFGFRLLAGYLPHVLRPVASSVMELLQQTTFWFCNFLQKRPCKKQ